MPTPPTTMPTSASSTSTAIQNAIDDQKFLEEWKAKKAAEAAKTAPAAPAVSAPKEQAPKTAVPTVEQATQIISGKKPTGKAPSQGDKIDAHRAATLATTGQMAPQAPVKSSVDAATKQKALDIVKTSPVSKGQKKPAEVRVSKPDETPYEIAMRRGAESAQKEAATNIIQTAQDDVSKLPPQTITGLAPAIEKAESMSEEEAAANREKEAQSREFHRILAVNSRATQDAIADNIRATVPVAQPAVIDLDTLDIPGLADSYRKLQYSAANQNEVPLSFYEHVARDWAKRGIPADMANGLLAREGVDLTVVADAGQFGGRRSIHTEEKAQADFNTWMRRERIPLTNAIKAQKEAESKKTTQSLKALAAEPYEPGKTEGKFDIKPLGVINAADLGTFAINTTDSTPEVHSPAAQYQADKLFTYLTVRSGGVDPRDYFEKYAASGDWRTAVNEGAKRLVADARRQGHAVTEKQALEDALRVIAGMQTKGQWNGVVRVTDEDAPIYSSLKSRLLPETVIVGLSGRPGDTAGHLVARQESMANWFFNGALQTPESAVQGVKKAGVKAAVEGAQEFPYPDNAANAAIPVQPAGMRTNNMSRVSTDGGKSFEIYDYETESDEDKARRKNSPNGNLISNERKTGADDTARLFRQYGLFAEHLSPEVADAIEKRANAVVTNLEIGQQFQANAPTMWLLGGLGMVESVRTPTPVEIASTGMEVKKGITTAIKNTDTYIKNAPYVAEVKKALNATPAMRALKYDVAKGAIDTATNTVRRFIPGSDIPLDLKHADSIEQIAILGDKAQAKAQSTGHATHTANAVTPSKRGALEADIDNALKEKERLESELNARLPGTMAHQNRLDAELMQIVRETEAGALSPKARAAARALSDEELGIALQRMGEQADVAHPRNAKGELNRYAGTAERANMGAAYRRSAMGVDQAGFGKLYGIRAQLNAVLAMRHGVAGASGATTAIVKAATRDEAIKAVVEAFGVNVTKKVKGTKITTKVPVTDPAIIAFREQLAADIVDGKVTADQARARISAFTQAQRKTASGVLTGKAQKVAMGARALEVRQALNGRAAAFKEAKIQNYLMNPDASLETAERALWLRGEIRNTAGKVLATNMKEVRIQGGLGNRESTAALVTLAQRSARQSSVGNATERSHNLWGTIKEVREARAINRAPLSVDGLAFKNRLMKVYENSTTPITQTQARYLAGITDARARAWATANGRPASAYYAERFGEDFGDTNLGLYRGTDVKGAKGVTTAVETEAGQNRRIIEFFKSADFSTAAHEFAHVFRADMGPEAIAVHAAEMRALGVGVEVSKSAESGGLELVDMDPAVFEQMKTIYNKYSTATADSWTEWVSEIDRVDDELMELREKAQGWSGTSDELKKFRAEIKLKIAERKLLKNQEFDAGLTASRIMAIREQIPANASTGMKLRYRLAEEELVRESAERMANDAAELSSLTDANKGAELPSAVVKTEEATAGLSLRDKIDDLKSKRAMIIRIADHNKDQSPTKLKEIQLLDNTILHYEEKLAATEVGAGVGGLGKVEPGDFGDEERAFAQMEADIAAEKARRAPVVVDEKKPIDFPTTAAVKAKRAARGSKQTALDREAFYRTIFKPGNEIDSYGGGKDIVQSFDYKPDSTWSVTVKGEDGVVRTHNTEPSKATIARYKPEIDAAQEALSGTKTKAKAPVPVEYTPPTDRQVTTAVNATLKQLPEYAKAVENDSKEDVESIRALLNAYVRAKLGQEPGYAMEAAQDFFNKYPTDFAGMSREQFITQIETELKAGYGLEAPSNVLGSAVAKDGSRKTLYQTDDRNAPYFYSGLERTIEERIPGSFTSIPGKKSAAAQAIEAIKKSPLYRAEEDKWTGLSDWLRSKEGQEKIDSSEILGFVMEQTPKVEIKRFAGAGNPAFEQLQVDITAANTEDDVARVLATLPRSVPEKLRKDVADYAEAMAAWNYQASLVPAAEWANDGAVKLRKEIEAEFPIFETSAEHRMFSELGRHYKDDGSGARWPTYHLPDGADQFEILISPNQSAKFENPHFRGETGTVHIRGQKRIVPDGKGGSKTILELTEIQNDWAQSKKAQEDWHAILRAKGVTPKEFFSIGASALVIRGRLSNDDVAKLSSVFKKFEAQSHLSNIEDLLPEYPHKASSSWVELGLKTAIRKAAEDGIDEIRLISGDVVQKIVGGEEGGQLEFYNEIIPNVMDGLGNRIGARVESAPSAEYINGLKKELETALASTDPEKMKEAANLKPRIAKLEKRRAALGESQTTQTGRINNYNVTEGEGPPLTRTNPLVIKLSPELMESVKKEGLPLFQSADDAAARRKALDELIERKYAPKAISDDTQRVASRLLEGLKKIEEEIVPKTSSDPLLRFLDIDEHTGTKHTITQRELLEYLDDYGVKGEEEAAFGAIGSLPLYTDRAEPYYRIGDFATMFSYHNIGPSSSGGYTIHHGSWRWVGSKHFAHIPNDIADATRAAEYGVNPEVFDLSYPGRNANNSLPTKRLVPRSEIVKSAEETAKDYAAIEAYKTKYAKDATSYNQYDRRWFAEGLQNLVEKAENMIKPLNVPANAKIFNEDNPANFSFTTVEHAVTGSNEKEIAVTLYHIPSGIEVPWFSQTGTFSREKAIDQLFNRDYGDGTSVMLVDVPGFTHAQRLKIDLLEVLKSGAERTSGKFAIQVSDSSEQQLTTKILQEFGAKASSAEIPAGRFNAHALYVNVELPPEIIDVLHTRNPYLFQNELNPNNITPAVKAEEAFAQQFEQHLLNPPDPSNPINPVLQGADEWMKQVYRSGQVSPTTANETSPLMREVMDSLFEEKKGFEKSRFDKNKPIEVEASALNLRLPKRATTEAPVETTPDQRIYQRMLTRSEREQTAVEFITKIGDDENASFRALPPATRHLIMYGVRGTQEVMGNTARLAIEAVERVGAENITKPINGQPAPLINFLDGRTGVKYGNGMAVPTSGFASAPVIQDELERVWKGLTPRDRDVLARVAQSKTSDGLTVLTKEDQAYMMKLVLGQTLDNSQLPSNVASRIGLFKPTIIAAAANGIHGNSLRKISDITPDMLHWLAKIYVDNANNGDTARLIENFAAPMGSKSRLEGGERVTASVLVATHGAAQWAAKSWSANKLGLSKSEVDMLHDWLHGRDITLTSSERKAARLEALAQGLPKDALLKDALEAKRAKAPKLAERFGLDTDPSDGFQKMDELGLQRFRSTYWPAMARKKLAAIMVQAERPLTPEMMRGLSYGKTAEQVRTEGGNIMYYMVSRLQMTMTSGMYLARAPYFAAVAWGDTGQAYVGALGDFRQSSANFIRMLPQLAVTNTPLVSTAASIAQSTEQAGRAAYNAFIDPRKAGKARIEAIMPQGYELIRRGLQSAGDKAAQAISGSRFNPEVNKILDRSNEIVPGTNFSYAELTDKMIETGVFASFDASELERALYTVMVNDQDKAKRLGQAVLIADRDMRRASRDLAENLALRSRLGTAATLIAKQAEDAAAAGKGPLTIDAATAVGDLTTKVLYDYANTMTGWDRHIVTKMFTPYQVWRKNNARFFLDNLQRPETIRRMARLYRFERNGGRLLSEAMYYTQVDNYGVNTDELNDEQKDWYYRFTHDIEFGMGDVTTWTFDQKQHTLNSLNKERAPDERYATFEDAWTNLDEKERNVLVHGYGGPENVPYEVRMGIRQMFSGRYHITEENDARTFGKVTDERGTDILGSAEGTRGIKEGGTGSQAGMKPYSNAVLDKPNRNDAADYTQTRAVVGFTPHVVTPSDIPYIVMPECFIVDPLTNWLAGGEMFMVGEWQVENMLRDTEDPERFPGKPGIRNVISPLMRVSDPSRATLVGGLLQYIEDDSKQYELPFIAGSALDNLETFPSFAIRKIPGEVDPVTGEITKAPRYFLRPGFSYLFDTVVPTIPVIGAAPELFREAKRIDVRDRTEAEYAAPTDSALRYVPEAVRQTGAAGVINVSEKKAIGESDIEVETTTNNPSKVDMTR